MLISSTGPHESKLKSLVPEENTKIKFLGFCSGEKLDNFIRGARAVVLPSEWYENAPISLLEAYACGKIVIGARIDGIPEFLEHDATGYLFKSGDKEELINTIDLVYSLDDSLILSMGRYAREFVSNNYTPERYMKDITCLYRELGGDSTTP